jgi:hypothetical protein
MGSLLVITGPPGAVGHAEAVADAITTAAAGRKLRL